MNLTSESLSFAMARRTLMQRHDGPVDESDVEQDAVARQMLPRVMSLADDGAQAQREHVTQALVLQQVLAAQDVSALWPHAPAMQIAAAQMTSKAQSFRLGGGERAIDSDSSNESESEHPYPREVG